MKASLGIASDNLGSVANSYAACVERAHALAAFLTASRAHFGLRHDDRDEFDGGHGVLPLEGCTC